MSIRVKIGVIVLISMIIAVLSGYFLLMPSLIKTEEQAFFHEIEVEYTQFENVTTTFLETTEFGLDLLLENENVYASDGTLFTNYLTVVEDGFTFNPSPEEIEVIEQLQFFHDTNFATQFVYVGYSTGEFIMNLPIQGDAVTGEGFDYDPRIRGWYQAAMDEPGELIFNEIEAPVDGDALVGDIPFYLTVSKTITNDLGVIVGVVGMDLEKEYFIDIFRTTACCEGFDYGILQDDKLIMYDDVSVAIESVYAVYPDIDLSMNEDEGFSYSYQTLNGVESIVITHAAEDENITFMQIVPAEELRSITRTKVTPLVNSFIGGIVGIVLVLFISVQYVVIKPLDNIKIKIDEITNTKDYTVTLDEIGSDELGVISASFNKMLSEINSKSYDMEKRINELKCLYTISNSARRSDSLEKVFYDTVYAVKTGWQYPEITRGRIVFQDKEYVDEVFEKTEFVQKCNIMSEGKVQGSIEVYYLEEKPKEFEGPFLKEEQELLISIAQTINIAIESKEFKDNLQKRNEDFEQQVIDRTKDLEKVSEKLKQSNVSSDYALDLSKAGYWSMDFNDL